MRNLMCKLLHCHIQMDFILTPIRIWKLQYRNAILQIKLNQQKKKLNQQKKKLHTRRDKLERKLNESPGLSDGEYLQLEHLNWVIKEYNL